MKLEDAIRERDECSKASMELIELCRRLIEKLKNTRLVSANDEAREAEEQIAKIIKGKRLPK
jgi:predicted translin family RNA/ssDNA-binding protein